MIVYGQILCICLHANEGRESKTKDSVYNVRLNFQSFFSRKKCALYTGKYGKLSVKQNFFFNKKYSAISRDPFYGFKFAQIELGFV